MIHSPELKKAAKKYYDYCLKADKAKGGNKAFFCDKREHYRKLTAELFKKEWAAHNQ